VSPGTVRVREADPRADRDAILAILARNLPSAASPARHDWLYLGNPDGPARVWIAEDAESGRPVGTAAAHPRRMRAGGAEVRALNLSDFAFDAAYRSLGPALVLLRATLEPVRAGRVALSYDFPSVSMRALYRRMGGLDLGPAERRVLLLRAGGAVRRRLGDGAAGRVAGAFADLASGLRSARHRMPAGWEVEPLEEPPGDEFDALDAALGARAAVRGVRDACYLRWRYADHPLFAHVVLAARRGGTLDGYAVLREEEPGRLQLMDLCSRTEGDGARALLAGVVRHARARAAEAVQAEVLAGSPCADLLRRLGFTARDEGPGPVPVRAPGAALPEGLDTAAAWWLIGGDRDL